MSGNLKTEKRKTILFVIVILFASLILCVSIYQVLNNRRNATKEDIKTSEKNKNEDTNNNTTTHDKNRINKATTTSTTKTTTSTTIKPASTTKTKKTSTTTKTTTTTTNKTVPSVNYSCPDGYTLIDKNCISEIDANYVCPEGTHDYSNSDIPKNTYCINLDEGYETDTESCPSGFGMVKVISFGGPSKYSCFPLHKKIYTCPDEYNLNDKKCTKIIDASIN